MHWKRYTFVGIMVVPRMLWCMCVERGLNAIRARVITRLLLQSFLVYLFIGALWTCPSGFDVSDGEIPRADLSLFQIESRIVAQSDLAIPWHLQVTNQSICSSVNAAHYRIIISSHPSLSIDFLRSLFHPAIYLIKVWFQQTCYQSFRPDFEKWWKHLRG